MSEQTETDAEAEAESDAESGPLAAIRADEFRSWLATVVAIVVGLALASVHWFGLIVGGALVALPTASAWRGLGAGFGFGVLAWLGFLGLMAASGSLTPVIATGQPFSLSAGIAVGLGTLGGLVRGIV